MLEVPEPLSDLIQYLQAKKYEELYEQPDLEEDVVTLDEAIKLLLRELSNSVTSIEDPELLTLGRLGAVLAMAVIPTIKKHQEYLDPEREMTLFRELFDDPKAIDKYLNRPQAFDEASIVYNCFREELAKRDGDYMYFFCRDVGLDLILEGYAIIPGSEGRRAIFDWLLLDVIPSIVNGKLPQNLYTIDGLVKLNAN